MTGAPDGSARGWRRCLLAVGVFMLAACAGEDPRGAAPIRGGMGGTATLPDGALDLAVPDAAVDAEVPDAGPPPDRTLWLVVRDQPYADGVRARLLPAHVPTGVDPREALPEAALLIAWAGPADDDRLARAWRARRPAGVLYDLGARIADRADPTERRAIAVADASSLAAAASGAGAPLRVDGAPLVVVDGAWDEPMVDAFEAARARARDIGVDLSWGAMIDPTAPWIADPALGAGPPADVALVLPRCAMGDPAARSRARQRFASPWLPCVSAPSNPRLDRPRDPADAPTLDALDQRLILARRVGAPVVVVDGVGGWRDDRQLDPVGGSATGAPVELTTAWIYRGYGAGRVDAVRRLLLAPARAASGPLGDPPVLLDLVRSAGVLVERLEQTADGLVLSARDATGRGRYEVLLDDRPFVVTPGLALAYTRTDPAVAVDLVFADGRRLLDLLPDDGALTVSRSLDPLVGRRVEEATLVYAGGRDRLDVRLADVRITPSP